MTPLLLGMGWFADQSGGLNRYFAALLAALREAGAPASAVVVGPASEAAPEVVAASWIDAALPRRLLAVASAARDRAHDASVFDVHFALYGLLPELLPPLRRRPLVVHFHGPWADESAVAGTGARVATSVKRAIERAVYRRADIAVTLSGAFKRLLVERYGVRPWNVRVVPPGIDLDRFSPGDRAAARTRLGLGEGDFVAFSARRLVPRMGLDVLLDAWAPVAGRGRVLAFAGKGPARADLEERVERLGIGDSVRLLGRVSEDELVDWYRAADVSVVPSVALEGFGLVVLESLACGTPVIATDVGGLPETLGAFDATLVVPAGDATALAERLAIAVEGTQPLPDAAACRAFAERFSWGTCAERHLELYAEAAEPPSRKKVRVVYLGHTAELSGGELALLRLLPALEDVEAHVILAEDGPLVGKLLQAGVSVEVLELGATARTLRRDHVGGRTFASPNALRTAAYVFRLALRLRRLRPDLVHTNTLKAALYGGAAARLAGRPVVWHVRDRIAPDYLPPGAVRLVRAAATRIPHAVIANSQATLATVGRPGVAIPSPAGAASTANGANGPFRAGIVGRIAPWKGQHVFVEAFARAFPNGEEQAVVVGAPLFGADEERYAEGLRALGRDLGLDGRLTFAGFRDDVAAELGRLDVLVHASVVPEPFGQVVVEGMAAGLPVVAAASGGPAEIVEDGVNGVLYPPGDTDALAGILTRLAADPDLRSRLGTAARETARAFAPEVVAAQVMDVYSAVLDARGRRAA